MKRISELSLKAALVVLGLTPILQAQQNAPGTGPQYCPPIDQFLTPTLLDVFIYPGASFR